MGKNTNPTGSYRFPFQWLVCTRTLDSTTGDKAKVYPGSGPLLWGNITYLSDSVDVEYGAIRSRVDVQIRFRGFLGIVSQDRLIDNQFGYTYGIDGVRPDFANYETIVDAHSLEQGTL